jgi:hypothetical protein
MVEADVLLEYHHDVLDRCGAAGCWPAGADRAAIADVAPAPMATVPAAARASMP